MTEQEIWLALEDVKDPEIPTVSVVDLGMITGVEISGDNVARITLTPTFAGCPALHILQENIHNRVAQLPFNAVEVNVTFDVAWTTNRISEKGRELLHNFGLAPPPVLQDGYISLEVLSSARCPFCGSSRTVMQSPFGPTLCRSIHYCHSCLQAFEQFKPV